jgi:hypothetical protein
MIVALARGIPQGSRISPLLANLYVRRFVLGSKMFGLERSLGSRIVTAILIVYEVPQYSHPSAPTLSAACRSSFSVEVTHAVFRIIVDRTLRVLRQA